MKMCKKHPWFRILPVLLCLFMLASCAEGTVSMASHLRTDTLLSGEGTVLEGVDSDYAPVCENDRYQFLCRSDNGAFQVLNKENPSEVWNSVVTQDLYDLERSTALWRAYMQSIVSITYVSKEDTRGNHLQAHSASLDNDIKVTAYEQGVRVDIFFAKPSIRMAVEVALTEQGVKVRLPAEFIKEEGDYYLLAADVLPFFEAAGAAEDGYIFMPDGCGTLMEFSQTSKKNDLTNTVQLDVYGAIEQFDLFDVEMPQVFFPVYGIKRAEKALFANVTQGDSYTRIIVNPAVKMAAVKLNRANFQFIYRHEYRIYLSNIVQDGKNVSATLYGTKCESQILSLDRDIEFSFLSGDRADYSGMAVTYREYLKESGALPEASRQSMPLALHFFMGDEVDLGLFKKMCVTTTYEDVQNILTAYQEVGVKDFEVVLQGWSKHGYSTTPQSYRPAGAFGGDKDFTALDEFLSGSDAFDAYLELNVTDATVGVSGFSDKKDVVSTGSNIPVTDELQTRLLLSPAVAAEKMLSAQRFIGKQNAFGPAVKSMGYQLYQDMASNRSANRWQTAQQWQKILWQASEERKVATSGVSAYSLAYTDYIYELPLTSSMSALADRDIPWVSMVLYGSVPMSSQPGNLSSDLTAMELKWVEYGSAPTYLLTQENPTVLRETAYNVLFSSRNDLWSDRVVKAYNKMSERLAPVVSSMVMQHEYVGNGVAVLTYDNGYCVGINYTDTPIEVNDQTVPAMDYLVWKGEMQ